MEIKRVATRSGFFSNAAAAVSGAVAAAAKPMADIAAAVAPRAPAAPRRAISADLPRVFVRLPRPCIAIVEEIHQERKEASALAHSLSAQLIDASDHRASLTMRRASAMDRYQNQTPFRADDPQILDFDSQIAAYTATIDRIRPRQEHLHVAISSLGNLFGNLENYVRRIDQVPDDAVWKGSPTDLKKGETLDAAIERCQRRVRELNADTDRIRAAPIHSSIVLEAEVARINALAERGMPDAFQSVEWGAPLQWPMVSNLIPSSLAGETPVFGTNEAPDVMAILAALFRDRMIEVATAAIMRNADDKMALSFEDREKQIAQIAHDRLSVERDEVAFVRMAKAQHQPVLFRSDIDPRALLGLGDDCPAPKPQ